MGYEDAEEMPTKRHGMKNDFAHPSMKYLLLH